MEAHLQKWLRKLPRRYKKYRQPAGLWSMTIPRELAFCESYARECFSGRGRIVDLGCWYGATTFSLARGLTRNRRAKENRVIDAFDLFIWKKAMDPVAARLQMPVRYRDGESFYDDVRKLLEPYDKVVRLHQQDLMEYRPTSVPVEFLFIDAMKSWPLAEKIVRDFFPLLIPGTSLVVQQDFVFHHPAAAIIHLLMWRLRDHFEWFHQVPRAGSVVFVSKKRIEADALPELAPETFTLAEIEQAYDYSLGCVLEEHGRVHIQAAKLLFLVERGYYKGALKHAQGLVENKIKFREHVLVDARQIIEQEKARIVRAKLPPSESQSENRYEHLADVASLLELL